MNHTRPNFILLIGEDAGRYAGCYGDENARTPNLDRLAASGCRFDNAFTTAPVCAPSRSTLVTGTYPWSIGTHHMRSRLLRPPRLFTEELRDAGYHVNWQNKMDFNFEPPESFADERREWLDDLRNARLPKDRPFFLYRNFPITHESTMWTGPKQDDGGGWVGHTVNERLRLSETLRPDQRPDPAKLRVPEYLPDTPEIREDIRRFYEALALMDNQVGEVLDTLDRSPHRDNTIVIYLTDHGRGLWREKRWCYGAGVHLSLLIRDPRGISPGSVSTDLVSWVDIAPTILSLAGVPVPSTYQGQVFLGPEKAPPREFVFAGRDRMDEAFDRVRAVRNKRWHYIRNFFPKLPYCQRQRYMENMETTKVIRELCAQGKLNEAQNAFMCQTKPPEELYDPAADPDMVRNLAADPAHAETIARMRAALDENIAKHGDLGTVSERTLINRGLVQNWLDTEYYQRIKPLPERYRVGVQQTVLEMPEE